jgi:hypothetical protein
MKLLGTALLAFCVVLPWASGDARAQGTQYGDKPVDLKPLVPPVVPLPSGSRLNLGTVGGTTPNTTAPLQSPNFSPNDQAAPGLRLTLPSR